MTRRRFMGSPNSLNPIVAPDGFDPVVQDVNIYKIFSEYLNTDKAFGYSFSDTVNTLTLTAGAGITYYYGYRRSGIDYTFTVNSVTNPFTAGDTKRFVIVNNTATSVSNRLPGGVIWCVYGSKNISIGSLDNNSTIKYVHYIGTCRITTITGFNSCTQLTGSLTIPSTVTNIEPLCFSNSPLMNGELNILTQNIITGDNPFHGTNLIMNNSIGTNWEIYDKILYKDLTRTYLIGSTKNKTGNLTILSSVTTIGGYAFYSNSGLTGSLIIPNTVITISNSAFAYCSSFNGTLTLGSGVATIGSDSFRGCLNFNGNLTIPNNVTSLGSNAFYLCSGFNGTLTISNTLTILNSQVFRDCTRLTGDIVIPNSVITIGVNAFGYCSGFNGTLILGNGVVNINNNAFYACLNLSGNITIPNSVITIGNSAFGICSKLTGGLTIPNNVTTIGNYAFGGCTLLDGTLTLPSTVTIGESPFYGTNLTLNDSQGTNWEIFDKILYKDLTRTYLVGSTKNKTGNLIIPTSVTTISSYAFYNCSNLTGDLIIPNNVTIIGVACYYGCVGLTGILTIGTGISSLPQDAFRNCNNLTGNLNIPSSVTTIGDNIFVSDSGFGTQLNINTLAPSLTTSSFTGLINCTELNLPVGYNPVVTVANYTFNYSSNLVALNLYNSIMNITNGTKTITIGTTNRNRVIAAYPTFVADYTAKGFTVV